MSMSKRKDQCLITMYRSTEIFRKMLKKEEGWSGCPPVRGTEEGMEPDDLLCSRNAA